MILQGQTLATKLIVGLLVSAVDPDKLKEALDEISGVSVDFSEKIEAAGNRPLIDFLGMNRHQINNRLATDPAFAADDELRADAVAAVVAAFDKRGMGVQDATRQKPGEANEVQAEANAALHAKRTGTLPPGANPAAFVPVDMPLVGEEQIPVNEVATWADADLRELPGFTDADFAKVIAYRRNELKPTEKAVVPKKPRRKSATAPKGAAATPVVAPTAESENDEGETEVEETESSESETDDPETPPKE